MNSFISKVCKIILVLSIIGTANASNNERVNICKEIESKSIKQYIRMTVEDTTGIQMYPSEAGEEGCLIDRSFLANNIEEVEIFFEDEERVFAKDFKLLKSLKIILVSCEGNKSNLDFITEENSYIQSIQYLMVDNCKLTTDDVSKIANSSYANKLSSLSLSNDGLEAAHIAKLTSSKKLSNLRDLQLAGNRLNDESVLDLITSPYIEKLEYLWLFKNNITDIAAKEIANASNLENLVYLNLDANKLTEVGIKSIRSSDILTDLEYFQYDSDYFSADY